MRVDVVVPNEGAYAEQAMAACAELERMGFDGLWLTDHVVGFEIFQPVYGDCWLETLSTLAYVAGITEKIRLGIGVLVVPYRDAVLTAKMLASIDVLSGGRVDLGIGTGWARAEFFALGRQHLYERRGAYTDEALDVMQTCWSAQSDVAFNGEFHTFRKVRFQPRPMQQPRIPLWIGSRGTAPAPLRRAAKYADYWHPTGLSPEELQRGSEIIDEQAGRSIAASIRGRVASDASVGEMQDWLGGYRDAGCVQAAVDTKSATFDEFMTAAQRLAQAAAEVR
ncbi:MAG: TIGR03619 family F420-dependent LLM class oxidoreductase [Gammaproteobacteria bacterium]|nr:TIGR03619 family F420-dependent LLM class oxidoreductase [Gammaproteobacteria bacterium]MDE0364840.1 TIGR03619 family F420-dependent LLM class oxidoreductase [Gammaproteobacteria bacterium]